MSRPRSPIVALAIGFLTAPVLGAQTATDLADVCKVVGNAKPGQWASFDATNGGSEAGKVRLAVVGSEQAGDTTLYWFEVSFIGKDPGHSGVVQILNPSLAAGVAAPASDASCIPPTRSRAPGRLPGAPVREAIGRFTC